MAPVTKAAIIMTASKALLDKRAQPSRVLDVPHSCRLCRQENTAFSVAPVTALCVAVGPGTWVRNRMF